MTPASDRFPAKLLLSGEFTVIDGGIALALPILRLYGSWILRPGHTDHRLPPFAQALHGLKYLDALRFLSEVRLGLSFNSSIPEGYGLGSSGALCAGVLHRYQNQTSTDLDTIQKRLAEIEHYFHGTSSGFDPLISYTRQAVTVDHGVTQILSDDQWIGNPLLNKFYLLDSMIARGRISSIDWYHSKKQLPSFQEILSVLNALNKKLIASIIHKDQVTGIDSIKHISKLQLDHFSPLIADTVFEFWQKGLEEDTYYTKLCGKGGGGYYLVYLPNEPDTYMLMPPLLPIS